ncbi:hypothetical protein G6F31_016328 [Rhizopus arrhizus]|nr:hypothetical protein G6F31_016328 [Rhizopus arrhizus]
MSRSLPFLALHLAFLALGILALAFGAAGRLVERDVLLRCLGAELLHVLVPPLEFLVGGDACVVTGFQLRQQRCEVAVLGVRHGGDAGPRQCVVVGAFAELGGIDAGREGQVRHHALVLGAAAADAEELGDGQLDLAEALGFAARPAIEVDDVLHGALAEAGFTDHQATTVVLDGAGEDFRGRGRAAVDQHRQRAIPRHALVAVAVDGDAAPGLTHLHHRALLDEQAGPAPRHPACRS